MGINLELMPFSFAAGVATFFSPCSGALLPMYVSLYLRREDQAEMPWWRRGLQGFTLGGVISAGFLTSISALGLLFALVGSVVGRYLPWMAVSVGAFLVITGLLLLARPSASPSLGNWVGRWIQPKTGNGLFSFYFYGLVYAICASACTLPIFLSVMTQTFISGGIVSGFLSFAAYGWGMSLMMLGFAVALAYSKVVVLRLFGAIGQWVHRAGGLFMIVAGGYVLYYLLIYGRYLEDLWGR